MPSEIVKITVSVQMTEGVRRSWREDAARSEESGMRIADVRMHAWQRRLDGCDSRRRRP